MSGTTDNTGSSDQISLVLKKGNGKILTITPKASAISEEGTKNVEDAA